MRLFSKVFNLIHKDMGLGYLTLSNIFDNERTKYTTHRNGWSVNVPCMYYRLHILVVILLIHVNVGYLG